ncbi:glycosyl hydrolase [Aspergillus aurantiobrunneus]
MAVLLAIFLLVSLAFASRIKPAFDRNTNGTVYHEDGPPPAEGYPYAHGTDMLIHDPSIILVGNTFYSYSVGPGIMVQQAPSLHGPWTEMGSVLDGDSTIEKGDREAPWAPNTIQIGSRFYCYYSVSNAGCRDSAIGVASSDAPGPGGWTDHGLMIQTGTGNGSDVYPLDQSNAIDPNVFVDFDGSVYLVFGSFWSGIWQLKLGKDLVSVESKGTKSLDASHLAAEPEKIWRRGDYNYATTVCGDPTGGHPIEGPFLSYHAPYYYLWFSWGRCCEFAKESMRNSGKEYRIRVGRSDNARGPFVDKQGNSLVEGGGETIYASNADVFAPGGQGVLTDAYGDILYYHYLNTTIGYDFSQARLGYNRLEYVDGWPVAV